MGKFSKIRFLLLCIHFTIIRQIVHTGVAVATSAIKYSMPLASIFPVIVDMKLVAHEVNHMPDY